MPLLDHFHPGRPFNILESDVIAWLCEQPEIRQEIFNYCKRHGAIIYSSGPFAKQVRLVCNHTLPWLISFSLGIAYDLRRRFARFKLGAHLLDLRRLLVETRSKLRNRYAEVFL
jgi:hypothetical protein